MDAKIINGDIAVKSNGDYDTVSDLEEAVQRVRMVMMTDRGAFRYARGLGVDYDAFSVEEADPVAKLDLLLKEGIADIGGVDAEVLHYDPQTAAVGVRVSYHGRTAETEVDISGNI